ncbi:DUF1801 domain-containing protein [Chryseobacterium sp. Tr-659]|uniref:DUF1801 domain-containing protein n=1 Tax=Chryseobacterium sp. Tr-659 TaxID=2608340 RepID=UPI0014210279|nr:DUF1801 domain-containing protein [Chryseobacterium sp. Tr-659]NIF04139.1 DUF1801 domain-containing protein [Chryseobacterium sp. Tr-659]
MQIQSVSIEDYISKIPEERRDAFKKLFDAVNDNLPKGFVESTNYGMVGWVVPLSTYPAGYHCAPGTPLPFINLASQKNFIALYHMGLYSRPELLDWFVAEYPKHSNKKLDMGKSCVRFKKVEDIPFDLIAELSTKMTAEDWIGIYESLYKR